MLNVGNRAYRRPTQRGASERLTRGDQPALDWTSGLDSRRDEPTMPKAATAPLPEVKSAGSHRSLPRRPTPAERRWLVASGAGVAALAVVGSLILFLSQPHKLLASACGAGGCRLGVTRPEAQPPAGGPASAHKAIRRSHPTATHSTVQPSPAPARTHPTPEPTSSSPGPQPTRSSPASPAPTPTTTAPSTTPTPSPTASPTQGPYQVSYAVVHQHPHSFQGKFTIVNDGSTAINGWELVAVLPDDQIRSVWDGRFHIDGDTLYIDPSSSQQTIAPGATLTENFIAHGTTTTLTSCMFNGTTAC